MAPRKRHEVGHPVKGPVTAPPTSTHAVNTDGFATLADEIYLEIVSYIPSVPIPAPINLESYPEMRRSRHETLLSLSQTSRSLRRFFWRYLWQRIEVREGMRIRDEDDILKGTPHIGDTTGQKKYAKELVRQLEIVTVRNPQLAQYVNYLDIFISEYSINTVLAELARCLTLFSNLHTVQIDVVSHSKRPVGQIFEQTFKKYSYPQIRNVFVVFLSVPFIASCPQARRVCCLPQWSMPRLCLQTMMDNCPYLEVLDFADLLRNPDDCKVVVDNFPNLRSIQFQITPFVWKCSSYVDILKKLNHLQTIIIDWDQPNVLYSSDYGRTKKVKEDWIELLKHILIQIQLRDNLEKTIVVRDYKNERQILLKPRPTIDFEDGIFES